MILADDGLQHYALARTMEIAVIDASRGFGNGLMLPAGPLREPVSRLREVDAVVRLVARDVARPPATDGRDTLMAHEPLPWRNLVDAGACADPQRLARDATCTRSAASAIRSGSSTWCARSASSPRSMHFPTTTRTRRRTSRSRDAAAILMTQKDAVKCAAIRRRALLVPAAARGGRSGACRPWWRTRSVDSKLLEMLVCPVTKGPLIYDREKQELISKSARLAYPIRDGIPVMLEEEARKLTPAEYE